MSSSLRNFTQEEINDYLSITRFIFSFEGRRSVICGICLLSKSFKKVCTLRKGQRMTWVICVVSRDFNKRRRGGGLKFVLDQPILFAHMGTNPKNITLRKQITLYLLALG